MLQKDENNQLLLILSSVALSYFLHPAPSWAYLIFLPFVFNFKLFSIKIQLQIISFLSLIAAFITNPHISQLFALFALGLTINGSNRLSSKWGIWTIYCALGIGIILRQYMNTIVQRKSLSGDIILLFLTLPNWFMSEVCENEKDRSLWLISPFLYREWTYSLGIIIGIFFPILPHKKYLRFFLIASLLLLEIFIQRQICDQILNLLRGVLIFDSSKHECERYFLIGYVVIDFFQNSLLLNYMFIGYLVMSIMIWQHEHSSARDPSIERPLIQA